METIFKYQLNPIAEQVIEMPLGAEVLTVQVQNGNPCIWAKVNPKKRTVRHLFRIIGTGHQINAEFIGKYIGTYQLDNGSLVFHVFQIY